MKRACMMIAALALSALLFAGCAAGQGDEAGNTSVPDGVSSATTDDYGNATPAPSLTLDADAVSFTDRDSDASFDAGAATAVAFSGAQAEISGPGAALGDGILTISAEGTYILSGDFTGCVVVDAPDKAKIQLVLAGVSIEASSGPAVLIRVADKVFVTLAVGTENVLADAAAYSVSGDDANVDAALFSRADLTVNGAGSLTITGNYKHGVVSKDDLAITGGNIAINCVGTALSGKDCVKICGGAFLIDAGGAGVKSENDEEGLGYVYICGGTFTIRADGKGVMGYAALEIAGGALDIVSGDDALHTNGSLAIKDGGLSISSGDDGVHADGDVSISGGTLTIRESYEGIEGANIAIMGGTIRLTASDDGLNAAGGADGSGFGGGFGNDMFSGSGDYSIAISGGYLSIDASGDGIDSNGSLSVTGGVALVSGPVNDGNGALDYMSDGSVTGGVVVAAGSSGMAQGFIEDGSTQCSLLVNGLSASGGTRVTLCDAQGNVIVSFVPAKDYASVAISAPALEQGETYTLYTGGALEGAEADENGYAASGTLTGGASFAVIAQSGVATTYGSGGFGKGGFPGGNQGGGNPGGGVPGGGPGGRP